MFHFVLCRYGYDTFLHMLDAITYYSARYLGSFLQPKYAKCQKIVTKVINLSVANRESGGPGFRRPLMMDMTQISPRHHPSPGAHSAKLHNPHAVPSRDGMDGWMDALYCKYFRSWQGKLPV